MTQNIYNLRNSEYDLTIPKPRTEYLRRSFIKAMSHGAILFATCNAILLLRDVNLANARLHCILLMYSSHIKQSSPVAKPAH